MCLPRVEVLDEEVALPDKPSHSQHLQQIYKQWTRIVGLRGIYTRLLRIKKTPFNFSLQMTVNEVHAKTIYFVKYIPEK